MFHFWSSRRWGVFCKRRRRNRTSAGKLAVASEQRRACTNALRATSRLLLTLLPLPSCHLMLRLITLCSCYAAATPPRLCWAQPRASAPSCSASSKQGRHCKHVSMAQMIYIGLQAAQETISVLGKGSTARKARSHHVSPCARPHLLGGIAGGGGALGLGLRALQGHNHAHTLQQRVRMLLQHADRQKQASNRQRANGARPRSRSVGCWDGAGRHGQSPAMQAVPWRT